MFVYNNIQSSASACFWLSSIRLMVAKSRSSRESRLTGRCSFHMGCHANSVFVWLTERCRGFFKQGPCKLSSMFLNLDPIRKRVA